MPANLTPDYHAAEARYRIAVTVEEKLDALREMLRVIPKHKGTDRLQGDIKRKISQLKKESIKKSATSRKTAFFLVDKEGEGQIFIVGAPNTGKSQLLMSLTNAKSDVAPYPYTTQKPIPGMMQFENIQFQLIDTPPIDREFMESWLPGIIRNGNLVLLLADLSSPDALEQIDVVMDKLQKSKIHFVKETKAEYQSDGLMHMPLIIVGSKLDANGAAENAGIISELYGQKFETVCVSALDGSGLQDLKQRIYNNLHIIRVYTKSPGKQPDFNDPVVLNLGETVLDFARQIHKDFAFNLKHAKIWGTGMYDGQKVQRDFVLREGDVLELHT
ncbi:MAG: hypothetical protein A2161_01700 [Candidatus Schekmanbacteria bacterium RBG_13_48_7]|uniref:TGS domain-containing protein n=1 Tax=Candidatus Schekmanbacteria bacterium RBG_13_48_7 TaxID=1817878 RepID=A0A1F7RMP9_9BACT|nr:MAG: hypothetical protein A2161_01700 [Candidatus Schekmanbacteria bacterium RBG_13_48_7]